AVKVLLLQLLSTHPLVRQPAAGELSQFARPLPNVWHAVFQPLFLRRIAHGSRVRRHLLPARASKRLQSRGPRSEKLAVRRGANQDRAHSLAGLADLRLPRRAFLPPRRRLVY